MLSILDRTMRIYALHACLLLLAASSAHAQAPPSAKATYFLIDASGSMARGANWGDVEDILARRVASILQKNPDAEFSFSSVAGDSRNCKTPIEIAPLGPFTQLELASPNREASTLLGSALYKAVVNIGNNDADIVILTDGSEQCGPSICDAANALLPTRSNIRVETIFTEDAMPADKARLSCIDSAQGKVLEGSQEPTPLLVGTTRPIPSADNPVHAFRWEGLLWVVTLALFILSAIFFAFHYARGASNIENEIRRHSASKPEKGSGAQQ